MVDLFGMALFAALIMFFIKASQPCSACDGSKKKKTMVTRPDGRTTYEYGTCRKCGGSGKKW